jgi:small GTP-binding protein
MEKETDKEYAPTISVDIKNLQVKVNDKVIQIQIWDCCGNDEFALNTPNLFKNAKVAILIYAINDKNKSFKDIESWYNMVLKHSYCNILFLIGNKRDLEKERKVTIEDAENFKKNYDDIKIFFETSAKSGENIDKLLENIAISIFEKNEKEEKDLENAMNYNNRPIKLKKENHKKKKKKNCICKL